MTELTDAEINTVLERFDQTNPVIQRRIIAGALLRATETAAENEALRAALEPDRLVVLSRDSDGNGHSPLADVDTAAYEATTTSYGEIGLETLTEEDKRRGYDEDDVIAGVPCVVLWPRQ